MYKTQEIGKTVTAKNILIRKLALSIKSTFSLWSVKTINIKSVRKTNAGMIGEMLLLKKSREIIQV
jgi:hypothetical protein